jgi:hypothetical protein
MAKIVGQLKAKLGLDNSQYKKGLKKSKKSTKAFGSAVKKVGGMIAGAFAVSKITGFVNKTINAADNLGKLQKQTGISAEALQKYRFAAERSGISTSKLDTSMQVFQKRLGELRAGTGSLNTRLKKMDPTFMKQLKNAENAEVAFKMYADRMKNASSETEQAALAQAGFSRSGLEMTKLMRGGSKAIEEYGQKAEETGGILSDDLIKASEKFKDQQTNLKMALRGVTAIFVKNLMPILKKVVSKITTFAKWVQNNIDAIKRWGKIIGTAVGALGAARVAMRLFNTVLRANPIGAVISAISALAGVFISAWKNSKEFRDFFKTLWIRIKQYGKAAWDAVKTYFGSIGKILKTIGTAIAQVFQGKFKKAKNTIVDGFTGIVDDFKNIGKEAKKQAEKELKELEKQPGDDTVEKMKKNANEAGKQTGKALARGVNQGYQAERKKVDMTKMEGKKTQGVSGAEEPTAQLASVDKVLKKNKQLQRQFKANQNEVNLLGNISQKAFQGMSNSLQRALEDGKNILDSFGKFFIDMLKSLIIKLVAAATAAFVLSLLLGGTGVGGLTKSLGGGGFKQAFGMIGGFGMQEGGVVPPGYPSDSYPAMLTSGEKVVPPGKLDTSEGKEELVTRVRGRDLEIIRKRWDKDKGEIT